MTALFTSRRYPLGLMLVGLAMTLAWISTGSFGVALLPIAVAFFAFIVAVGILVQALVLRAFKLPPPPWPGLARQPAAWRKLWIGAGVVVGLVTLLREGALAPEFSLEMNWYEQSNDVNWTTNHGASSAFQGEEAPRMAGREVSCRLTCQPVGAMCDAFERIFGCDGEIATAPEGVDVTIDASLPGGVFCYTPLYKETSASFAVTSNAHLSLPSATTSLSVSTHGDIDQSMTGLGSCHTFKRIMGEAMARAALQDLNAALAQN